MRVASSPEDHPFREQYPPVVERGQRHSSYGPKSESVAIQQYYDLTSLKKSLVRMNDELIPKPTEIKIGEKQIQLPFPAEHPYQSHISRFALFPSLGSPDDLTCGVRAAARLPLNPLAPAGGYDITVLSKTKGGPYRHERVDLSTKKALNWPGQYGYYQFPKSSEGFGQVFYPSPPKTTVPNTVLRPWDKTLSEKTANTVRNLEKSHWLTSYQLSYTGNGPMNPVQLDDYQDKMIKTISGESNLFAAQLREQSHPVFSPPRPLEGCHSRVQPGRRAVSWSDRDRGPTHPAGHEEPGKLHNKSVFKRETDDTNLDQDLFSQRTDPSRVNCLWSEPCEARGCSEGYRRTDIPQGQEFPNDCPEAQPEKGLTFKITDTPHDTCPPQSGPRLFPEYRLRTAHPHVPLRGNALEGQHVGKPRPGSALLELQDSYSRSDAHKRLHESLTGNAADLRDNAHSGRRHKFFGFNSYYFHN